MIAQTPVTLGNLSLVLGVDPKSMDSTLSGFIDSVRKHTEVVRALGARCGTLKPNLAFFLAYGSKGIQELESFCEEFRHSHQIILDGKFNEIQNSAQRYFLFAFKLLKVNALTLNPFLGQNTVSLALEAATKWVGAQGKIFVLCATSEAPSGALSHIQGDGKQTFRDLIQLHSNKNKGELAQLGLVVGATRRSFWEDGEFQKCGLPVLAPGLGAQGAPWEVIGWAKKCQAEVYFPVSRGVFGGGNFTLEQALERFSFFENQLTSINHT